ncbi:MAG: DUF3108 domain-containing protein [Deltaproteobacteria bacterium]|nr:DUF3108 domain-containing protein [Deltaproteobacteria bacterium]
MFVRIIKYLLFIVLVFDLTFQAHILRGYAALASFSPAQSPAHLKERITFSVKWSFVPLINTSMETFFVPNQDGPAFYLLTHQAAMNSFWNDRMESLIDSKTLLPRKMETIKKGEEGDQTESIVFDRQAGTATFLKPGKGEDPPIEECISISAKSMDPLSAFYYMRKRLSPENPSLHVEGITGPRRFKMQGKLVGKETLKVPAGTFVAYRLECRLDSWVRSKNGEQVSSRKTRVKNNPFTLWVSADENRFPVQIRYRLPLGSLWVRAVTLKCNDMAT